VMISHQTGGAVKNLEDMLSKPGGQGGQEGGLGALSKLFSSNGGMQGITSKLSQNGMGQEVQSWIGHGQNQPVSGDQIQGALDRSSINELARQTGQTPEQASSQVAQVLPERMNQATPQGQMPSGDQDPFSKGMNALKHLVSR
jgi:uncharacterized protein YidB (DUF937 family)